MTALRTNAKELACHLAREPVDAQTLSDRVGVSIDRVNRELSAMIDRGLVQTSDGKFSLTEIGRIAQENRR